MKRCFENMQQIYRRTPTPKFENTLRCGCFPVNLLHIFRTTLNTSGWLLLNWEEWFKFDNREETVKFDDDIDLNNILSRHKSVFNKELGTLKNVEVALKAKSEAIPKYCKTRFILYVLNDRVKKEFERLVTNWIVKPFFHSEWASQIVPIVKPDSSIRIFVNCGKYPIPRAKWGWISSLSEGELFTKLI